MLGVNTEMKRFSGGVARRALISLEICAYGRWRDRPRWPQILALPMWLAAGLEGSRRRCRRIRAEDVGGLPSDDFGFGEISAGADDQRAREVQLGPDDPVEYRARRDTE
jgi:hypothetical protein